MISLAKLKIFTPLQKLPKNVGEKIFTPLQKIGEIGTN